MSIAIFTAVAVLVGVLQFNILDGQLNVMKGQLDQMAAGQRPWIMVASIEPQGLTADDQAGVSFWVKFLVKNVGHSPAQNVSVSGKLLMADPMHRDQTMTAACQKARERNAPGRLIFPGQPQYVDGDIPRSFDILAKEVWAAREARVKSSGAVHYVNPERARARIAEVSRFPFHASFDLVGCINYGSEDNRTLHQLSFRVSIGAMPNGGDFPILSGEPIPDISPDLSDPDVAVLHSRKLHAFPADEIKLGMPEYGAVAD